MKQHMSGKSRKGAARFKTRRTKSWARTFKLQILLRILRKRGSKKLSHARLAGAGLVVFAAIMVYNYTMPNMINPTAYTPLLDTIAKGESRGNYNAHFGNATNDTIKFTEMTIGEVLQWQQTYVQQGSPSSAVGKYQIVRPTLVGLVNQLAIDHQTRFDPALQDRLGIALLERRGAQAYIAKELTREQFAANLAKEWAALPRIIGSNPEESYYAHDGLNKSQISIDEVFAALASLEHNAL